MAEEPDFCSRREWIEDETGATGGETVLPSGFEGLFPIFFYTGVETMKCERFV